MTYIVKKLNDDVVKIIHSARQDVEAIFYRFGIAIQNIFDTQIGYKYMANIQNIGYSTLVEKFCNTTIIKDKKIQNSNWLKRPISEKQIMYAKQDVLYLHEIYERMMTFFLQNEKQYQLFLSECSWLEDEKNYAFNPKHYWDKIKYKFIHNINREIIKKMFILREKLAYKANIPREFAIKSHDLLAFACSGDASVLKTNYKIDKNRFIDLYKNI